LVNFFRKQQEKEEAERRQQEDIRRREEEDRKRAELNRKMKELAECIERAGTRVSDDIEYEVVLELTRDTVRVVHK